MQQTSRRILTINGGSSSIKFALFDRGAELRQVLTGGIERIGLAGTCLRVKGAEPGDSFSRPMPTQDFAAGVRALIDWLTRRSDCVELVAVGHRVVHGGPNHYEPHIITSALLEELRALQEIDPEHLPQELRLIESIQERFPGVAQLACFDTAFHHDLPRVARLLPIPRRYEAAGVRRYGFHGLSYEFMLSELGRINQAEALHGRLILTHLGNGSSIAAVHGGKSIDTSMSFTPAAGVPMSTRSGDLDPGLGGFLARTEGMSAEQFERMVSFQSGLLGISETSSDMRDLLETEAADVRAREAVAIYCYQIKKWIGAYAAALGGVDTLVFAGGIGEHAPVIRERICAGLSFLGIVLDQRRNAHNAALLSSDSARIKVRIIATDEQLVIARAVARVFDVG